LLIIIYILNFIIWFSILIELNNIVIKEIKRRMIRQNIIKKIQIQKFLEKGIEIKDNMF